MDWLDNEEQAGFRTRVQDLITSKLPERYQIMGQDIHQGERQWENDRKSDDPAIRQDAQDWVAALSEQGWAAPHWPTEYGGGGLRPIEQFILNQELAQAGAPSVGGSGVSLLGPALIIHGTDEQKAKYLPPILRGEVTWAQGFSEPGAGSDLASLQTRAVRDGDEFVINGQKIWTSAAHLSDAIFALTRTDTEAPKHRGISFLLVDDIKTPGLTLRPLVDMGNHHYFNETFFEDVRVPVENILGEENRGWYVGMTLLDFERSNIGGAVNARKTLRGLLNYLETDEGKARSSMERSGSMARTQLAERFIETEVMYQFSFRVISMHNAGQLPNYEASMSKLFNSELSQRIALTGAQVFGLYGDIWAERTEADHVPVSFADDYVRSVPATIRGGTSEIQRNIIATRGLGLPRG
jgi:alkylation response protein AidB-like acyl-CoA dehydrogenase